MYPEVFLRDAITHATGVPVFPVQAPIDAVTPFAVYMRKSTERITSMQESSPMAVAAFEVMIVTSSRGEGGYMEGKELSQSIINVLKDYRGLSPACIVLKVIIDDQADGTPAEREGQTDPDYVQVLSITINYEEQ